MIGKTTRRTMMAMVGASVSAAAVAVPPTPSFAAPAATNADKLTPAQIEAFKQVIAKARATGQVTPSASASPNGQAAGDCDTFARFDNGGGLSFGTPARSDGLLSCTLRNGDDNLAVGKLQSALNLCYGQGLTIDNDFGGHTQQAVTNVQNVKAINPANGVYDARIVNGGFFYPIVNSNNNFIHECINFNGDIKDV
jgi:hypothetical protein